MLRLRGYHCCYVLCVLSAEAEETVELENIVQNIFSARCSSRLKKQLCIDHLNNISEPDSSTTIDETRGLLGEHRNEIAVKEAVYQHVNFVVSRQKTCTWLVFYSDDGSFVSPRILSR